MGCQFVGLLSAFNYVHQSTCQKFSLEPTSLVEDPESTGKIKDVEERQRGMEKGHIRLV